MSFVLRTSISSFSIVWSRMERDVSLFNRFLNYDYDTRCRLPVRIYKHGAKNNNPTLPSRSSNHIHRFPFVSISRGKRGRKKKKEKAVSRINKAGTYTRACNVTRAIYYSSSKRREEEPRGKRERGGDRWLFSGQRTDGWRSVNHPGAGCVTRTSDANLARVGGE